MPNVNVEEFLKRFIESDAKVVQARKLRSYIVMPPHHVKLTGEEKKGLSKEAIKELLQKKLAAANKVADGLTEASKNGFRFIVNNLIKDERLKKDGKKDLRWVAYILASICHESQFLPKRENHGQAYGGYSYYDDVAVDDSGTPWDSEGYELTEVDLGVFERKKPYKKEEAKSLHNVQYYGRGYIQITCWSNYNKFKSIVKGNPNLTAEPDLALKPEISYEITVLGMVEGLFMHVLGQKGKSIKASLGYFIHDQTCDYFHARNIVNGINKKTKELDCAKDVANIAIEIESILRKFIS